MSELIAPVALKELVAANSIRHAVVVADDEGYKVNVRYGMIERTVSVRTREGKIKVRVFQSLDAVARFLHDDVHLPHYEVNMSSYPGKTKRSRSRPDTARRMRETHEIAAYNKEFIARVDESLADPRPNLTSEEVEARFAARRAASAKKLAGEA